MASSKNPQMLHDIQRIKTVLQKEKSTLIDKAREVQIAEIIVTLPILSKGEYEAQPNDFILSSDNTRVNESDNELIERWFKQITKLAYLARSVHLKNNFNHPTHFASQSLIWEQAEDAVKSKSQSTDNKKSIYQTLVGADEEDTSQTIDFSLVINEYKKIMASNKVTVMKEGCENKITRVSTSEFYFYPCKERGPIEDQQFLMLIAKLEDLAKELPQNLHLALGTFPVFNKKANQLQSVHIYIQCGDDPIITTSTKARHYKTDPNYNFTMEGRDNLFLTHELSFNLANVIIDQFNKLENGFDQQIFEDLKKTCQTLLTINHDNFVFGKQEALIDLLKSIIEKQSLSSQEILQRKSKFIDEIYLFLKISAKQFKNLAETQYVSKPTVIFDEQSASFNYGGIVDCKTAAGVHFKTVIDICLDHFNSLGQQMLSQQLISAVKSGSNIEPQYISQLLCAYYVDLKKSALLTQNEFVTFVNPYSPAIGKWASKDTITDIGKLYKEIKKYPSVFGGHSNIKIYQPLSLGLVNSNLLIKIGSINDLILEMQALRIYRFNHPAEEKIVSDLIDKCMIKEVLKYLKMIPDQHNELSFILKNLKEKLIDLKELESTREKVMDLFQNSLHEILNVYTVPLAKELFEILDAHHTFLLNDEREASLLRAEFKNVQQQTNESKSETTPSFWKSKTASANDKVFEDLKQSNLKK